jgi:hypothetical protein
MSSAWVVIYGSNTLVGFVAYIQVAIFWFVVSGLVETLGHMALVGIGFSRVVIWLEGCILARPSESEGVVVEVVGLDGAEVVGFDGAGVVGLDGAEVGDCPTQARGLDSLRGLLGIHPSS